MLAVRGVVASRHANVNSNAKQERQRGNFILINLRRRWSKKGSLAMLGGDKEFRRVWLVF
jgi:hypothetical protein